MRHVIKYDHKDGKKLSVPVMWCGCEMKVFGGWAFTDAQHLALSVGGSIQPCKDCIKAIITELMKEL